MKEIIFTVGLPGSGKTELVKQYIAKGYKNFNRDIFDGSIEDLHNNVSAAMRSIDKVILDNTYITLEHRKQLVDLAKKHGASIIALNMKTSFEDCQFNICMRKELGGREVPVSALYGMRKKFEEPNESEGFSIVDVKFTRIMPPEYKNKAIILDYDGTVRTCPSDMKYPTHPDHITIIPGISEKIQQYKDQGYLILGASNQSGVGKGLISTDDMDRLFRYTNTLLKHPIDVLYCPDSSFPIKSYDRKPLPGMGVKHIVKYKLDPAQCIMIGDATSDKTFASRCGFKFIHADKL